MAYTLRNDPGFLTPYEDDNSNNRRVVTSATEAKAEEPSDTLESQTIEITAKNYLISGVIDSVDTNEITSALVRFPNTQRLRKQDEPYELTGEFSKTGRQYTKLASKNLKVYTRSSTSSISDPLNTVNSKDQLGAVVFTANANIPFLSAPGKKMNEDVASVKLTSPDASSYQYIEIENDAVTIGATTDKQFSISMWFYLNNEKETILLTKGVTTQEYELKINEHMKIEFKTYDASGNTYVITSDLDIEPNKWMHVVLSSMGNDWSASDALTNNFYKLYINKTIDKNYSITCSTYDATGTRTTAEHVFVGYNDAGDDNNFDGLIAEVAIWQDYYLKKKEVVAMYDSATKSLIKMDTSAFDSFRQGVSVTTDKYKNESILYKLSSNNQRNIGRPDHYVEQREFGQPVNYEGNVPFEDIEGRYTPYDLDTNMILSTDTVQYPVVYNNNILEPTRNNGVLEPLAIRETILNNSADAPWQAHRISGEICGGNSNPEFGTILISNDIKRIEDQQKTGNIMINDDCYFDASEQAFVPVTNSAYITIDDYVNEVAAEVGITTDLYNYAYWFATGSPGESRYPRPYLRTLETITFPVPGFSSDVPQTEVLFDDTVDLTTNELITETETISSLLTALPDSSRSNHLIKSAPSGFIYGNNPEGTDSLAFGGLLRK
jgi:hypothetical protein